MKATGAAASIPGQRSDERVLRRREEQREAPPAVEALAPDPQPGWAGPSTTAGRGRPGEPERDDPPLSEAVGSQAPRQKRQHHP